MPFVISPKLLDYLNFKHPQYQNLKPLVVNVQEIKYKFFVDGEWRHDDHQPFVSGNYGVVNTIFLAREPDMIPAFFSPETPGRSNMDVDNDPFHRLVASPRMSQADIELSRNRISVFLSTHTAYELLPDSGKVIALDVNLPVKQAFHILYEQGIPVAPLWDFSSGQFVGVLSALDFILILRERHGKAMEMAMEWKIVDSALPSPNGKCLGAQVDGRGSRMSISNKWAGDGFKLRCNCSQEFFKFLEARAKLGNHGSNLTEEELETHTISAWKEGKLHLNGQIDGNGQLIPRRLIHAGPYDSLRDVALKLLQNKISTLPVVHSSSQDGSFPQLLHLASLSGILKCICRNFRHSSNSLPILQQPICSIPMGTWVPKIGESNGQPFAMLRPNASLSAALSLLVQAEVSSIPIVDDNDSLVDMYCRSDITALAKDRAYAQIRLDEMSIHQAVQLGQDGTSPYCFFNGQRCQMCLRSDPLHKVMERLAVPGVRRLVIVEAGSKRVEGIISLSDVFKFLLS
ncbi:hypothetical protein RJ639_002298 [Escallonia herrerae]|uniref:CBS domain-containing protein n=1 Tax=Escallonia herrerae TaxID=1293975 RepID=A0AA88XNX3_9ASTE|nr:hypothetical protein RJ639_002298 [Escallonia herrerae]